MALLTIVVVVAVLKLAEEVFIPLALAILMTFLLAPLVERLVRWRVNRALAVVVSMVLGLALIGGLGRSNYSCWARTHPRYCRRILVHCT